MVLCCALDGCSDTQELTSDVGSPNTASEDEGQNEPVVLPDDDEGSPIGSPCSSTSSSSSSESSSSSGTSAGGGNAKPKKLTKKKKRDGAPCDERANRLLVSAVPRRTDVTENSGSILQTTCRQHPV